MEFRESVLIINAKNEKRVKENMVFNAVVSLKNLKTRKGREFAVKLADTVLVGKDGIQVLTSGVAKKFDDIGYTLDVKIHFGVELSFLGRGG